MALPRAVRCRIARFSRGQDGSIAIEAVIILPAIFMALMVMLSTFDAYRQHAINQKAAYTIGDLISRQTTPMDSQFLIGARSLFDYLTRSSQPSSIRVTSVGWDADSGQFALDWSRSVGAKPQATSEDVREWKDRLPAMAEGDYITVVETWSEYDAPFSIGLQDEDIVNYIFTRPRYASPVHWSGS
ncbi:hypothetical protein AB1M95_12320 [Sulfitobacter sp. LCG007]